MRIAVPAAIDPAAISGWRSDARIVSIGGATMGTTWRVKAAVTPDADVRAIERRIVALLGGIVAEMSHWDAGSVLGRFNRAAPGSWTALPPAFARVMAAAVAVAERSGGAFDPAIGALVDAWGFGPAGQGPGPGAAPDDAAIAAALGVSGWRRLSMEGARLRQPGGVRLDLSGIAKGHAVDAVADLLAAMGIGHALVEIGGELAGRGLRPDGEPWWVDLEAPPGAAVAPLRVALHGLAVATSGDYVRGGHTIDPRTGRPATAGVRSVGVIHASAMMADAWATALSVLGAGDAMALAVAEGLACRWVHAPDAAEVLSPAMRAMIDG